MAQQKSLADWHDGDALSAAHWQEAVDMLRPLSSIGGGGMTEVTQFPEGTTVYTPEQPAGRSGFFPVKVEKTGGSDGSASTTASWTYTVRRTAWTGTGTSADFELGTTLPQVRPRPVGEMIFQTGSVGYGVGFYDETGAFKLWDAGEVPDVGSCP